jgi:hypothetical protein
MCASRIATPVESSAEPLPKWVPPPPAAARTVAPALGRGAQVGLLMLNAVPLLHAASVILALVLPSWGWGARLAAAATVLWLLPPLLGRFLFAWTPLRDGRHALGSRVFWSWWTSLKLQTLYLRLPFTEEVLRLVPGCYSMWLRLWGARIGRLTYWAPGLEITDRPLLSVGDNVVFGGKARVGAHILQRTATGELELLLGRIHVGHRVMIGAQAAIAPGVRFDDDEFVRAFFLAAPFTRWRDGRRVQDANSTFSPPSP